MERASVAAVLSAVSVFSAAAAMGATVNGWTANGSKLYTTDVDNAKVGIGVSNPKSRLHLMGMKGVPGLVFELPSSINTGNNPKATMQWEGAGGFSKWRQYFNSGENGWALAYNAEWDYANTRWLPSSGFSALMRFDVSKGDTGQNALEIKFAPSGGANGPEWGKAARYAFYDGKHGEGLDDSRYPARFLIEGAEGMGAKLSLTGGGGRTNIDLVVGKDSQQPLFKIQDAGSDLLAINTNTGNVGIGTTAPGHKLTVVGTAGLTTGTAWTQVSDGRYKDVQAELKGSSLEKIMALRPVAYKWNSLYQGKYGQKEGVNYGFIAQEVKEVIPELVTQDQEGYFWYNPSGFEALLTAAAQEQEAELASLREELKSIKAMLDAGR